MRSIAARAPTVPVGKIASQGSSEWRRPLA